MNRNNSAPTVPGRRDSGARPASPPFELDLGASRRASAVTPQPCCFRAPTSSPFRHATGVQPSGMEESINGSDKALDRLHLTTEARWRPPVIIWIGWKWPGRAGGMDECGLMPVWTAQKCIHGTARPLERARRRNRRSNLRFLRLRAPSGHEYLGYPVVARAAGRGIRRVSVNPAPPLFFPFQD